MWKSLSVIRNICVSLLRETKTNIIKTLMKKVMLATKIFLENCKANAFTQSVNSENIILV